MSECCLKLKDNEYLCTKKFKPKEEGRYISILTAETLEDLINYALTYKYDFELPKGYSYKILYSIVCTTGNFMPEIKEQSNCNGCIIYSTFNKKNAENEFKKITKLIKNNHRTLNKNHFCWHTEDYAINQIIHSYDLVESFVILKEQKVIR